MENELDHGHGGRYIRTMHLSGNIYVWARFILLLRDCAHFARTQATVTHPSGKVDHRHMMCAIFFVVVLVCARCVHVWHHICAMIVINVVGFGLLGRSSLLSAFIQIKPSARKLRKNACTCRHLAKSSVYRASTPRRIWWMSDGRKIMATTSATTMPTTIVASTLVANS